jgi:hypothetical protein
MQDPSIIKPEEKEIFFEKSCFELSSSRSILKYELTGVDVP